MKTVVVIGGGMAGIGAACELRARAAAGGSEATTRVLLLEAGPRLGGKVETLHDDGFLIEWAANGWLGAGGAMGELAAQLGLEQEILRAERSASRRYIFRGDRLHLLSFGGLLAGPLLSLGGRLRMLREPFTPPRSDGPGDESVEEFAARRVGPEAARVLASAAIAGIYGGDSRQVSMPSAFPKVAELEAKYGSLLRGMMRAMKERRIAERTAAAARAGAAAGVSATAGAAGGAGTSARTRRSPDSVITASAPADATSVAAAEQRPSRGGMYSLRGGMGAWAEAAQSRLAGEDLRLDCVVQALEPATSGFRVITSGGRERPIEADAVVLAVPAGTASALLRPLEPRASEILDAVVTCSLAVVGLAFSQGSFRRHADGYGFLVPREEKLRVLGALWESNVFAGRAPEGQALVRVMIGGARSPELVDRDDAALIELCLEDLNRAVGLVKSPTRHWVRRQRPAIPQYTLGHASRIRELEEMLSSRRPALQLAGNTYHGVSVPDCVQDGRRAAAAAWDLLWPSQAR